MVVKNGGKKMVAKNGGKKMAVKKWWYKNGGETSSNKPLASPLPKFDWVEHIG